MTIRSTLFLLALTTLPFVATSASAEEYRSGIEWKKPEIVTPGSANREPPSDAIVLFDGKDLSKWNNGDRWSIQEGNMISGRGKLVSKESFGDCQLHLEWSAPAPPKGNGQGRGNSGIFFMDKYEIRFL